MMNRRLIPYLLILLSICSHSYANELYPAHIEINLEESNNDFYRVVMDINEDPYLSIDHLARYLLGMNGGCTNSTCSFFLPEVIMQQNLSFTVDLPNRQCTNENNTSKNIKLIEYEDKFYTHWKSLEYCLPITADWFFDNYELKINRKFKTLSDLEKDITKIKQSSREAALIEKTRLEQHVYPPSNNIGISNRISAIAYHDDSKTIKSHLLSDMLISSQNSLTQLSIDTRIDEVIDYYNISISTNEGMGTLQFGDVTFNVSNTMLSKRFFFIAVVTHAPK